jgi:hypothetical protein
MKGSLLITILLTITITVGFAQNIDQQEGYVGENNQLIESALDLKKVVEVYPNPAIDFLNIDVNSQELVQVEFEVYDIIGNTISVSPEKLTAGKYRVPVSDLHSGYYMLIVRDPYSRYRQIFKFGKR